MKFFENSKIIKLFILIILMIILTYSLYFQEDDMKKLSINQVDNKDGSLDRKNKIELIDEIIEEENLSKTENREKFIRLLVNELEDMNYYEKDFFDA